MAFKGLVHRNKPYCKTPVAVGQWTMPSSHIVAPRNGSVGKAASWGRHTLGSPRRLGHPTCSVAKVIVVVCQHHSFASIGVLSPCSFQTCVYIFHYILYNILLYDLYTNEHRIDVCLQPSCATLCSGDYFVVGSWNNWMADQMSLRNETWSIEAHPSLKWASLGRDAACSNSKKHKAPGCSLCHGRFNRTVAGGIALPGRRISNPEKRGQAWDILRPIYFWLLRSSQSSHSWWFACLSHFEC